MPRLEAHLRLAVCFNLALKSSAKYAKELYQLSNKMKGSRQIGKRTELVANLLRWRCYTVIVTNYYDSCFRAEAQKWGLKITGVCNFRFAQIILNRNARLRHR